MEAQMSEDRIKASGWLTARQCETARPPKGRKADKLADGNRLFLQVTDNGKGRISRSWIFKYQIGDKRTEMGLGPLHVLSLKDARAKARELSLLLLNQIDPLTARQEAKRQLIAGLSKQTTFAQVAADYLKLHESSWRHPKHYEQWERSLNKYVLPKIGRLHPKDIDHNVVFQIMQQPVPPKREPLWTKVPVTASRVLDRIALILDLAASRNLRSGDNPARHIRASLPKQSGGKVNFPAMEWQQIPIFMAALRERREPAAAALEYLILTASRSNEVFGAKWDEIDLSAKTWTVPGTRMKGGVEHAVPLSNRAFEILKSLPRHDDRIFPAVQEHDMRRLLRVLVPDASAASVHGFRSSFRQWASVETNIPDHVIERSLAHQIGSQVERVYARRAELFSRRATLMEQWGRFCTLPKRPASVVSIRSRKKS
jgi:integrase